MQPTEVSALQGHPCSSWDSLDNGTLPLRLLGMPALDGKAIALTV